MKKIEIGDSKIKASAVSLGVMRISEKTPDQAAEIIKTAVDNQIDFFDTADIYGGGRSSRIFGQAVKDIDVKRDNIFIQSKGGIITNPAQIDGDQLIGPRFDFSKQHLLDAVDIELERLQTDYLDFFLLHRPDTLMRLEEVAAAFNELEKSGKVRNFGVSNMNPNQVELLQSGIKQHIQANQLQFGLMHTHMLQSEFHVNMEDDASVDHDGGILAYSRLHHQTIQAWSPFQYGFFEGVFVDNIQFPKINQELQLLAEKYDVSKSSIAVAWILYHPADMQVIIGSMTPSRIEEMTNIESSANQSRMVRFVHCSRKRLTISR